MRGTINSQNAELDWIEFFDPKDATQKFRVCVTFILSGYHCLFGQGCPGLLNRGVRYDGGCCEQGVTFTSTEDFDNVKKHVGELTAEDCDNIDWVREKGWFLRSPKGYPYKTRKKNDRCIFANLDGGSAGKPGCSFHHLAERTGQRMIDTKPEICWTVPIAFDHSDGDNGVDVLTINAFDADDWGGTNDDEEPDGKGHMGYWCIDTPDAFDSPVPVWKSHEQEFRKMMGDSGYERLVQIVHERGWDQLDTQARAMPHSRPTRMPGEVRNEGRPMLPLLIAERG